MERLRMGVLGCSGHYFKRVALPLRESLLVEPYAIASRDGAKADKAAASWDFSKAYGSYEALLADDAVDFVYIPLPNHMHLEYIKKSADAGKAILCEKPLGLNAHEAREAADYCAAKGVALMEAFMYRFHPQWRRARALAESFDIGTIKAVHCWFSYTNKDPNNIRNKADFGGGALLDIGCYAVSSARFLIGAEPERVLCLTERDPVFKTDILSSGILDFGGGRRAAFTVGTQAFSMQRVDAYGSDGALTVELPFNMYGDVPGRISVANGVGRRVVETEIADQYLLQFDAFAEALIAKSPMPTPVEDAIANMAALDALALSAASGAWTAVAKA
ncbi:MAG TPA: gfo/Idh/MocA family oxidoreductase [Spirochaetaceae bacterium]|nr:gfo/Idh/MocA family oxidoreductase [Spirochaetaceae bacterium]